MIFKIVFLSCLFYCSLSYEGIIGYNDYNQIQELDVYLPDWINQDHYQDDLELKRRNPKMNYDENIFSPDYCIPCFDSICDKKELNDRCCYCRKKYLFICREKHHRCICNLEVNMTGLCPDCNCPQSTVTVLPVPIDLNVTFGNISVEAPSVTINNSFTPENPITVIAPSLDCKAQLKLSKSCRSSTEIHTTLFNNQDPHGVNLISQVPEMGTFRTSAYIYYDLQVTIIGGSAALDFYSSDVNLNPLIRRVWNCPPDMNTCVITICQLDELGGESGGIEFPSNVLNVISLSAVNGPGTLMLNGTIEISHCS